MAQLSTTVLKIKLGCETQITENKRLAGGLCETLGRSLKNAKCQLMTWHCIRIIHLVIKLNVDKRKIATTAVHFSLPLTINVHRCHQNDISNLRH